ncbi:Diuretic hormone receptor [Fasciola hepatica]|uniref:Diuretic hormone receptor n=1 Tax=Fasciola hepatica TaxID=6192 RepID=A0A4E0S3P4_FASHE|nr:Diuretic hormone receptor [Fasciola hepatica]
MFVEGFYLFLIVHYTYRAEKVTFRWYALIGWGIPSVLTIIRITVDAVMNPLKLWVLEGCDRYLVTIPVLSMLGLNALFLIAILYALSGKLRRSFSPTGITTTPPPSIQLRPLGYPSATARPLPGSYGRLSCPPMLALSSSEIQHHPTTNEDLANTSSTNSRGQRNSSTLVPLDLQNSMDLAGKYGERSCRPKRSASVSAGMKPRWGRVQSDVSFSLVKQQGLSLNQLGNPSRRNSSLGSRMRLRQFVGRLNAREFAKTVKAGLLLMPLLGLPEIIFITPYHPSLKPAFDLITAFLRSTQGFWVALLYCFLTQEVRQQLAIRKRVCSARSSIRPTQRWPPLLRQQSPQIRGPTAINLFDYHATVNVFLIRQRQSLTREYFIASGDLLKKQGLTPSPFIVEFPKFRNPQMFDRTPVRGMQYIVVRCSRDGALMAIKQHLDVDRGFVEMEAYLYTYSPPYSIYAPIQKLFPQVKATVLMIRNGQKECSFRREFQSVLFERHMHPMVVEPPCPDLNVDVIFGGDKTESEKQEFRKRLIDRLTYWVQLLRREQGHFIWIMYSSVMYSQSDDKLREMTLDSMSAISGTSNSVSRIVSAKTEAGSKEKSEVISKKEIDPTASSMSVTGENGDTDVNVEDEVPVEENLDKPGSQLAIHPAFARSYLRIMYRATRAMVRLQLLTEFYIKMFKETPDISSM